MDKENKKVFRLAGVFFASLGILIIFVPKSAIFTGYYISQSTQIDPIGFFGIGVFIFSLVLFYVGFKKERKRTIEEIIQDALYDEGKRDEIKQS